MNHFLGIDQGGTKTQVAVCAEDGTIVGAATGGALVFYLDDPQNASTAIARTLAENILANAGLSWDCLTAACGGLNGVDWPHETEIHAARLREGLDIKNVLAVNDAFIALRAGSSAPNRCVVVAGTGLNIATRAEDGTEHAYGYHIPNRLQGGGAMGEAVIAALIDSAVGVRPATKLSNAVLALSGCASVEKFLTDFTTRKLTFKPQSLYPCLLDAALEQDPAALDILRNFTDGLAAYVANALTRHLPSGCDAELVFSGGVFKGKGALVSDTVKKNIEPKFPRVRFVDARLEPVCGALLMLLDRRYNGKIPENVKNNFEVDCLQHDLTRKIFFNDGKSEKNE
jgi:N-acetylglucosamine kinase-like BadF-type ATPase